MMSAKFSDFLTSSPLSAFGSDLYYKIHATSLTLSAFPCFLPLFNVDIISGTSLKGDCCDNLPERQIGEMGRNGGRGASDRPGAGTGSRRAGRRGRTRPKSAIDRSIDGAFCRSTTKLRLAEQSTNHLVGPVAGVDPLVVDGAHVAGVLGGRAERALYVARAAGGGGVDAELVLAPARRDGRVVSHLGLSRKPCHFILL